MTVVVTEIGKKFSCFVNVFPNQECDSVISAYIHTNKFIYAHPCNIHAYIHACMHACIHTYIQTDRHTYIHIRTYVMSPMDVYTQVYLDS